MKRSYAFPIFLSGLLVLFLGACAHKPVKSEAEPAPMAQEAPPQHTVLLQEARVEAEQLRAELASLKILMAKQSGELRSLQEQNQGVQKREQERGMEIQTIRAELMASQAERDQLRQRNIAMESQLGGFANTTQLVTEIQTLRTAFQQVMANLKTLSSDLTLIKQAMHVTAKNPKIQQTALSPASPAHALPDDPDLLDSKGRVVIQEGDTLWALANRHHVSVDQLKEWNHLSSDLIMTGLRLRVVSPDTTTENPMNPEADTTTSAVVPLPSEAKEASHDTHVQEQEPSANPVKSETKNLLSVSTP